MKTIYVFQHSIDGEIVEEGASFDLEQVKTKVKEIQNENVDIEDEDGDETWVSHTKNENTNVIYYAYDQYAREAGQEEIEILIKVIPFLDWKTSPESEG
ncbi:MAG: hypothetical protein WCP55_03045 [Lentisphaerota bacterium]